MAGNSFQSPVPGEPSLGTPHKHSALKTNTNPGNNNVQVTALPAAVIAARPTYIEGYMAAAGNTVGENLIQLFDTDGITIFDYNVCIVAGAGIGGSYHFKVPVDTAGNIRWSLCNYSHVFGFQIVMKYYGC